MRIERGRQTQRQAEAETDRGSDDADMSAASDMSAAHVCCVTFSQQRTWGADRRGHFSIGSRHGQQTCLLSPSNRQTCLLSPSHRRTCLLSPSHRQTCLLSPSHRQTCLLSPSHRRTCLLSPSHRHPGRDSGVRDHISRPQRPSLRL
jgi:hypothetical protein